MFVKIEKIRGFLAKRKNINSNPQPFLKRVGDSCEFYSNATVGDTQCGKCPLRNKVDSMDGKVHCLFRLVDSTNKQDKLYNKKFISGDIFDI